LGAPEEGVRPAHRDVRRYRRSELQQGGCARSRVRARRSRNTPWRWRRSITRKGALAKNFAYSAGARFGRLPRSSRLALSRVAAGAGRSRQLGARSSIDRLRLLRQIRRPRVRWRGGRRQGTHADSVVVASRRNPSRWPFSTAGTKYYPNGAWPSPLARQPPSTEAAASSGRPRFAGPAVRGQVQRRSPLGIAAARATCTRSSATRLGSPPRPEIPTSSSARSVIP
jgi:hypothetical protein